MIYSILRRAPEDLRFSRSFLWFCFAQHFPGPLAASTADPSCPGVEMRHGMVGLLSQNIIGLVSFIFLTTASWLAMRLCWIYQSLPMESAHTILLHVALTLRATFCVSFPSPCQASFRPLPLALRCTSHYIQRFLTVAHINPSGFLFTIWRFSNLP